MTNILLVVSSPREGASLSSRFAIQLANALKSGRNDVQITVRDLASPTIPHIDKAYVEGRVLPPEDRTPEQSKAVGLAEQLIAELSTADAVVIGSGMINFSMSSLLKAWFDHVIWPGVTVKFTDTGVEGLIKGKKVYLVAAAGGVYADDAMATLDFQMPFLRHLLAFIGLTEIEEVRVEGTAFGPDALDAVVSKTIDEIGRIVAKAA
jgi:FMN-dependent NADH-azoreductase